MAGLGVQGNKIHQGEPPVARPVMGVDPTKSRRPAYHVANPPVVASPPPPPPGSVCSMCRSGPLRSLQRSAAAEAPARWRPSVSERATVGLAFGGGSARGIAHVGVIRWFEEHRIPIDVAAGTSMGGLVGGAFASGMDAASCEASSPRSTGMSSSAPRHSPTRTSGARPTRAPIRRASSSVCKAASCRRRR